MLKDVTDQVVGTTQKYD